MLIPSLINPPDILDLSERRSLARWLRAQGHDVWLVDWGTPDEGQRALGLAGHVEKRLLPLLAALPRAPLLVGYCLGGTLALSAAIPARAKGLVTIAAPWQFDGFTPDERTQITAMWDKARALCAQLGYVPMEILQSGFWALDPQRTIRKYAAFADMEEGSDTAHAFMTLEDWANGGPPLTFAVARDLFDGFYRDNLSASGGWTVAGKVVDPGALSCPSWSIRSSTDRIVPADAAPTLAEQTTLGLGHVGMIVGGRARHLLWEPLSDWLFKAGDRC